MISQATRTIRFIPLLLAVGLVSACGLPSTGPTKSEIFKGSVQQDGDAFVLKVDDRINMIAGVSPAFGFSDKMRNAGSVGSDTIRAGDVLGLTVWENVDNGLLATQGANATLLEEVQVDGNGFIFVPYAGRIKAAGNTPEAIRRIITNKLADQTPDPQVQVRRLAGDGASVSILGLGGGQGVFPIERPTRTLSAMLARAGGIGVEPEIAKITLVRGKETGTIFFSDLTDNPGYDVALRDGDKIIVEKDDRTFTALGATGGQSRVPFESKTISVIEALAQVGGLNGTLADPAGVFVFRNEPEGIAERLTGRDLTGTQRVAYVLDLTSPNGIFLAREFAIRDQDTLYVTEAPFAQFSKVMSALTGSLTSVGSVASAGSALGGK